MVNLELTIAVTQNFVGPHNAAMAHKFVQQTYPELAREWQEGMRRDDFIRPLLEQTIAYLNERVQFDARLASFQVLRHRVADLYVAQENARALVSGLLDRVAEGEWPERELDLAKLHLGLASRRFAAATIQLHGGMGMTEELPASRLAKRLLMVEFEYGGTPFHETRLLDAQRAA